MKRFTSHRFKSFTSMMLLILLNFTLYAQVGIGTTDPKTALDVNGALSLREGSALSLANGTNDGISLGSPVYSIYRIITPTNDFNITGIVPVASANGQIVVLQNTTSEDMTIIHDGAATAANGIYISGEKDVILTGRYTTVSLQYSSSLSRWIFKDKLNHIETRYHGPVTINPGYNTYTALVTDATVGSSASVNFAGTIDSADAADLIIEYIEVQAGQVIFRIYNDDAAVTNVTFALTLNKL